MTSSIRFGLVVRIAFALVIGCLVVRPSLKADDAPATKKSSKEQKPAKPQPAAKELGKEQKPAKPQPAVTVSKETTFLTEPLDEAGYVDYLAALNEQESKGLTPDANAAVLFVRALGVEGNPEFRKAYFKLLGIDALPEDGEYLAEFYSFIQARFGRQPNEEEQKAFDMSLAGPWSAEQFPLVAEWLQLSEEPLKKIAAGSKLKRCYFPLVKPTDDDTMISVLLPTVQQSRTAARALVARAMLRLHEGKIKDAREDLLTLHRMGRLVGNTPFLIAALVGCAFESMAYEADARLLQYGKISSKDALTYQAELRRLAPLPSMADRIDQTERLMLLDVTTTVARRGPSTLHGSLGSDGDSKLMAALEKLLVNSLLINWDEALKLENQQFDKLVAAAKKPTAHERADAFHDLEQEVMAFRAEMSDPVQFAGTFLQGGTPRQNMGRSMGKILVALLMPAVSQASEAENRAHTRVALMQIGCALVAYRADNGKYPETLDELAPKYIEKVPNDRYTEQALTYAPENDLQGFLLYSVEKNETDDLGQSFGATPPADDIPLQISRVPAQE